MTDSDVRAETAEHLHHWTLASAHPTSAGWIRYERCACGRVRIRD